MKSLTNLTTFVILSLLSLTIFAIAGCGSGGGDAAQVSAVASGAQKSIVPGSEEKFVPDELLIQFYAGVSKEKSDEVLHGHGVTEVDEIKPIRVKRIKVPEQALEQVKAALARNPHVKFVEKNFIADVTAVPDDPSYPTQWHLPKIAAPAGWDITTGNTVVPIAIIDSGIDPSHPDLALKLLQGYNFISRTTDTHDVYGHGTKVAGSAAAAANNSIGVAGVAWQNPVLPIVVVDATGSADYANMASAIVYAADRGVRVISMSISGTDPSSALEEAVSYAWNKGSLFFASAGNTGTNVPRYPAACAKAIAVSATDSADNRASYSNYGSYVTLAAPGSNIYTTANGGGYTYASGTSFSTPITAGLAALIVSINPALTNQQVKDILVQNADDLGVVGYDEYFGFGRINAAKSLAAAKVFVPQPDIAAPSVAFTSPGSGSLLSGAVSVSVAASDNTGVSKVEFYVDGTLVASTSSEPFTFYWDTKDVSNGSYQLTAKAYDMASNVSSATITVTVSNTVDTIPPVVKILSPAPGATVAKIVKISVSATDNVSVSRTEIYVDGVMKAASTSASLSYSWNVKSVATGQHVVMAKAFDGAGNTNTSSITVYK